MTYPRRLLTDNEDVIRDFRQHWRLLIIPFLWVVLFVTGIVITWRVAPDVAAFDWAVTAVVGALLARLGLYPFIAWWFTHYVLTTERLIRRSGILSRAGIEIPLENITNLAFSQNVLERVLRSGDLLIESAGEHGQQVFGDIPNPESFQSVVYKVRELRTRALKKGAGAEATDPASQLERIAALLREGLITEAEFDRLKARVVEDA